MTTAHNAVRRWEICLVSSLIWMGLCLLAACESGGGGPKPEEKVLTKAEFLARIVVPERYWRIEEVSRQQNEEITTVNVKQPSSVLSSYYMNEVIPMVAVQLSRGAFGKGKVTEAKMSGAYGSIPFGEFQCVLMPKSVKDHGEWGWDKERNMIKMPLPESIRFIAGALSGSKWLPDSGFVASQPAPLYRGVEEARLAASPERIKFVIEQQLDKGKVSYVFTMRAAWLTDVDYRDADHKYGVSLY